MPDSNTTVRAESYLAPETLVQLAPFEMRAKMIVEGVMSGMHRSPYQGMAVEFVENQLFQPFESTKGITGMGIGAYQTREYVRSIGGDVQVSSVPGAGTQFMLRLPLKVGA